MVMQLQMYRRLIVSAIILLVILAVGTVGFWLITDKEYSLLDTLYMTFITITTIGFAEIIDISSYPGARAFTMVIAIPGISLMAYTFSNLAALIIEGEVDLS